MNKKTFLAGLAILAAVWTTTHHSSADVAAEGLTVKISELREFLLQGFAYSQAAFEDIRCSFESHEKLNIEWWKRNSPGFQESDRHSNPKPILSQYIRKGNLERSYSQYPGGQYTTTIYDGEQELTFYPTKGTADTETQTGRAYREVSSTGLLARGYGPVKLQGYKINCLPQDVLRSPDVDVAAEPQEINGLIVYRISAPMVLNRVGYQVIYWLAPDRDGFPVRMELREKTGELKKTLETIDFMKLPDGQWFPKEAIQRDFVQQDGKQLEVGSQRYVVTEAQLHPKIDPDATFDTTAAAVPKGYLFSDHISGTEYAIGEGPMSDERIRRIVDKTIKRFNIPKPVSKARVSEGGTQPLFSQNGHTATPAGNAPAGATEKTSSGPYGWLAFAVALIAASVSAAVLKRRARRLHRGT